MSIYPSFSAVLPNNVCRSIRSSQKLANIVLSSSLFDISQDCNSAGMQTNFVQLCSKQATNSHMVRDEPSLAIIRNTFPLHTQSTLHSITLRCLERKIKRTPYILCQNTPKCVHMYTSLSLFMHDVMPHLLEGVVSIRDDLFSYTYLNPTDLFWFWSHQG